MSPYFGVPVARYETGDERGSAFRETLIDVLGADGESVLLLLIKAHNELALFVERAWQACGLDTEWVRTHYIVGSGVIID